MSLVVEYSPRNQATITRAFDVDRINYKDALATGKAMVSYLPKDPEIRRVTRFAAMPHQILMGLGAITLFSGYVCLWIFMRLR